jgi:predicted PurR-regulated permease PerM
VVVVMAVVVAVVMVMVVVVVMVVVAGKVQGEVEVQRRTACEVDNATSHLQNNKMKARLQELISPLNQTKTRNHPNQIQQPNHPKRHQDSRPRRTLISIIISLRVLRTLFDRYLLSLGKGEDSLTGLKMSSNTSLWNTRRRYTSWQSLTSSDPRFCSSGLGVSTR